MPNDADWIAAAIKRARETGATTPNAVWTQLEVLLRGGLSERPAPAKDLERSARQLIDAMVTPPLNPNEPQ